MAPSSHPRSGLSSIGTRGAALFLDKPRGITSHDAVIRLRRLYRLRRVGHAGTLDPMATGLLAVALGPATRLLYFLNGLDKAYEGEIVLGAISTTMDAEGLISPCDPPPRSWPSENQARQAMRTLTGWIEQRPSIYSAIRHEGRRLYEYARAGEDAPVPLRAARVDSFDLTAWRPPRLEFRCEVSSGTYARSLAHDLGQALGVGGYLSALRRTRIGPFHVDRAVPLEALERDPALAEASLRPALALLLHLPWIQVDEPARQGLAHGHAFASRAVASRTRPPAAAEPVAVVDGEENLLAICRAPDAAEDSFKPIRVFPEAFS